MASASGRNFSPWTCFHQPMPLSSHVYAWPDSRHYSCSSICFHTCDSTNANPWIFMSNLVYLSFGCFWSLLFPSYLPRLLCIWLFKMVMNWNVKEVPLENERNYIVIRKFRNIFSKLFKKECWTGFLISACMLSIWLLNILINWNVMPQRSHLNVEWN